MGQQLNDESMHCLALGSHALQLRHLSGVDASDKAGIDISEADPPTLS